MNNKTLAIVFGALMVIYLLTKLLGGSKERSFDPEIIGIDTSEVTLINVDPSGEAAFSIKRVDGNTWVLEREGSTYAATSASVMSLLGNLVSINAERVVSKNPERFKDYGVDVETGTSIKVLNGDKVLGNLMVGRFNFNQATRSGTSYVKKGDGEEVYAVEGFMSMSLSQGMDNYRNKELLKLVPEDLTKLTLEDGGNATTVLRPDSIWRFSGGELVDSAAISTYLNALRSVNGGTFAMGKSDVGVKTNELVIEGNNMGAPVVIECYASADTSHHFVIHSSLNEEGYFFSDSSGIYDRLFAKFPYGTSN